MSIVQMLERLGHTVVYPEAQTLLRPAAVQFRLLGRSAHGGGNGKWTIFRDAETVVIASGSCGAMVKVFYPELFRRHPREAEAKAARRKNL